MAVQIPGDALPSSPVSAALDSAGTKWAVYNIDLVVGAVLELIMTGPAGVGNDYDLYVYPPGETDVALYNTLNSSSSSNIEQYTVWGQAAGTYYVAVEAYAGSGSFTLDWKLLTPRAEAIEGSFTGGRRPSAITIKAELANQMHNYDSGDETGYNQSIVKTADGVYHVATWTNTTDPRTMTHFTSTDLVTWTPEVLESWAYSPTTEHGPPSLAAYENIVTIAYKRRGDTRGLWTRTLSGGNWTAEADVDADGKATHVTGLGTYNDRLTASMAYATDGTLWIAYSATDPDDLWERQGIAIRSKALGGAWSAPTWVYSPFSITDGGTPCDFPQLLIDGDGELHLTFTLLLSLYQESFGICYARTTSGVWGEVAHLNYTAADWAQEANGGSSMALLPSGEVIVAWMNDTIDLGAVIASLVNGTWTITNYPFFVQSTSPYWTPAVVAVGGNPSIIFGSWTPPPPMENSLYITSRDEAGWSQPTWLTVEDPQSGNTVIHPVALVDGATIVFGFEEYPHGAFTVGFGIGVVAFSERILPSKMKHIWLVDFITERRCILRNAR